MSTHYQAVNGPDTAELTLNISGENFYGKYVVRKGWYTHRTGDVSDKIKGDTLVGDYLYKPYGGGEKKRMPFALLRKGDTLLVGNGVTSSYMGIL